MMMSNSDSVRPCMDVARGGRGPEVMASAEMFERFSADWLYKAAAAVAALLLLISVV